MFSNIPTITFSLERKSKVSQKPCCNDLCEVAILKELVDRTVERDFTQKPQMRSFIKKVYESVFKYVLLNCTLNRDVCKRTWYNPFNPVSTGLFRVLFRWGSAKLQLRSLFLMLQPQKVANTYTIIYLFQKFLKKVDISSFHNAHN